MATPKNVTATVSTWTRCNHNTGWFITAKFWFFKKSLFVCTKCGAAIEEHIYRLMHKEPTL